MPARSMRQGFGVNVPSGTKPGALKTFDLKTGAPKASYDLPAGTIAGQMPLCNDMVVAARRHCLRHRLAFRPHSPA